MHRSPRLRKDRPPRRPVPAMPQDMPYPSCIHRHHTGSHQTNCSSSYDPRKKALFLPEEAKIRAPMSQRMPNRFRSFPDYGLLTHACCHADRTRSAQVLSYLYPMQRSCCLQYQTSSCSQADPTDHSDSRTTHRPAWSKQR